MPLTRAQLEEYREEAMAEDIDIEFERMQLWTEPMARSFFESGGEEPAADPELLAAAEREVLRARLEKEGMAELWPVLEGQRQTIGSLVALMRTNRPQFLPSLKEWGMAKLPDRQKLRDLISAIANPPEGSEDKLREEHAERLARWPWCVVEAERFIAANDVDTMLSAMPPEATLSKYVVRAAGGVKIRRGRELTSGELQGNNLPAQAEGTVLLGDEESWAVLSPTYSVHVYVPNVISGSGFLQGWVSYMDVSPLVEGKPIPQPAVADYPMQRAIQRYFERGYLQFSLQVAIDGAIDDAKATGKSYRQACNDVYMEVRGPALLKLGFHPSADGLDAWMAARQPADDLSSLSDEDYVPLVDAHNRIVALMGGNNPANIVDALATRAAGVGSGAAAAATAEADS